MAVQSDTTSAPPEVSQSSEISQVAVEGISAGLVARSPSLSGSSFSIFFNGRPFYTPNMLGNALFRRSIEIEQLRSLPISVETVVVYTWVHALTFCVIGGVASRLLALADETSISVSASCVCSLSSRLALSDWLSFLPSRFSTH
jgi:hypothetical protein